MRTFNDTAGNEWTVFEVRRTNDEANWAYLPRGFRAGWLCFESSAGKRRLSPVPDGWKQLQPSELDVLLRRSTAVGRASRSLNGDGLNFGPDDIDEDIGSPA